MVVLLSELDFAQIEASDATDGVVLVDDSWSFSLGFREDNIDKICGGGNDLDLLEVILRRRHGDVFLVLHVFYEEENC